MSGTKDEWLNLSPELFEKAARESPWYALQFAPDRLSPELLAKTARIAPWAALEFAASVLSRWHKPHGLSRGAH